MLIRKLLWLNDISSNAQFDLSFDKLIYGGEEFADQSMKLSFGRGYIQIENLKLKSLTRTGRWKEGPWNCEK